MNTKKLTMKTLIGSAVVSIATSSAMATAAGGNPFQLNELHNGYQLAEADVMPENKTSEGKCGKSMKGKMDANGDGKVSKEEFVKHHEQMFDMMDKDKNGVLDDSEMGHGGGIKESMPMMDGGGMGNMKH